jgi:hypothetical protein
MSIDRLGGGLRGRGHVKASRREFDHRDNLFMRQMEPFLNLGERGPHFQIVKYNGNRRPRVAEYPCAAASVRNAFNGGALGPIEICHIRTLFSS